MAETFQIGDTVELRASYTPSRGKVVRVGQDEVRVVWQQHPTNEKATTERPSDLRKVSR